MKIATLMIGAVAALALSACTTHLQSGRTKPANIPQGVVYHLPHMLYDVDATREIIACPARPGDLVGFKMTAKATPRIVAGEPLVIAYEDLASITKTSDIAIDLFPNGTLKSVNFTVDDRTADVASEVFKSAVSIGKIAFGLPPGIGTSDRAAVSAYLACSPRTEKGLAGLPDLRRNLRDAEGDLKTATKALADYLAAHPEANRTATETAEIKKRTRSPTHYVVAKS